jgi:solute carrier family 6 (neurotransmitter transporter)
MQIASHNKHKHLLQRDSSLVAVITFTILLLTAFLANTCVQILRSYGYNYLPDSFGEFLPSQPSKKLTVHISERISSYTFLRPLKDPLPPPLASTPVKYMVHNSFFLGEKVSRPGADSTVESGYQVCGATS